MMMNRIILFLVAVLGFQTIGWSQEEPDYTAITFKNKLFKYKKEKPNLKDLKVKKEYIKDIVFLLGNSFYSENELQQITDNVWLSFIDPKKYDFIFKDIGVRTTPKWNKKNARGNIVLDPNPFLVMWTESNNELEYIHKALTRVLSYYNLMADAEDAKSVKRSLGQLHYTHSLKFRPAGKTAWTNSYLQYANTALQHEGLVAVIANGEYHFAICRVDQKDGLINLFENLNWNFSTP